MLMLRGVVVALLLLVGYDCRASLPDLHDPLPHGFGGSNESNVGEKVHPNRIQYNFVATNPEGGDHESEERVAVDYADDTISSVRDIILDLLENTEDQSELSADLRSLIMERRTDYLEELHLAQSNDEKLPHPKKLLYYLAPKIPAIRHSKDATLKIRVAQSEIDCGVAACLLATLAVACEEYGKAINQSSIAYSDIATDRKFAQVMECLLCAVDPRSDKAIGDVSHPEGANEISTGLSIFDCCRASWAISMFVDAGVNYTAFDQVPALAMRASDLLQQNLLLLQTGDIHSSGNQTLDDQIRGLSCRLAKHAAASLWTFAQCVQEDVKFPDLFELCSRCLISDPIDMRKTAQEIVDIGEVQSIGSNDVVERLAAAEDVGDILEERANVTSQSASDVLIDWLSAGDVKDVVVSLALHGVNSSDENQNPSEVLQELAFDRVLAILREDIAAVTYHGMEDAQAGPAIFEDELTLSGSEEETKTLIAAEVLEDESETAYPPIVRTYPWGSQFSAEDLCSIGWAITALHDPLHSSVVVAITELLGRFGPSSLVSCQGSHIADLLWSIAKVRTSGTKMHSVGAAKVQISEWATNVIRSRLSSASTIETVLLPQELSRLLWSLAVIYDRQSGETPLALSVASELAEVGLSSVIANKDKFSCEDLARIVWAFSVLYQGSRTAPILAFNLGRLVCRLERDLLNWEQCRSNSRSPMHTPTRSAQRRHSVSFLGKAKIRFPFLDQKLDDIHEEEQTVTSGSRLPLLRDLPVDPLTLCKATCAVRELFKSGHQADETLTRISLRLLVSRHGRLMSETPIEDLVHPVKVATTSSIACRELSCQFTRVFLLLLNKSEKQLPDLNPHEFSEIIASLGDLGAKHTKEDSDTASAHRRVRLLAKLPCYKRDELADLPNKSLLKMLVGLTTLVSTDSCFPTVGLILDILEGRIESLSGKCMIQCISRQSDFLRSIHRSSDMVDNQDAAEKAKSLETQYDKVLTLISFHFTSLVPSLDNAELADAVANLIAVETPKDEVVLSIKTEVGKRVSAMSEQPPESSPELWFALKRQQHFELGRCKELIHLYEQAFQASDGNESE